MNNLITAFKEGGSEKHINDINSILAGTPVDEGYLKKWLSALGLAELWKQRFK